MVLPSNTSMYGLLFNNDTMNTQWRQQTNQQMAHPPSTLWFWYILACVCRNPPVGKLASSNVLFDTAHRTTIYSTRSYLDCKECCYTYPSWVNVSYEVSFVFILFLALFLLRGMQWLSDRFHDACLYELALASCSFTWQHALMFLLLRKTAQTLRKHKSQYACPCARLSKVLGLYS